ncbi:MAG TPA: alpha/beta hydrolase [Acidimicrobiia bacterium]|nr:alpha/beta hydrolase [Acidimicrobiia bacterium]
MPTDRFVEARDGVPLAVRDHGGEGPPLLLMHGAGIHLLSLERLAARLRPFRVVTMDQRWSGQSGDSPSYSWDDLVSDVEVVIDDLGLDNPAVGGHSWGGMISAFYGAAHPEAPAVINLDGHGSGDPSLYDGLPPEEVGAKRAELEAAMEDTEPKEGDDAWKALARERLRAQNLALGVPEDEVDEFTDRSFLSERPGHWRQRPGPALMEGLRGDQRMFDVYRSVECPLLVVLAPALPPVVPEFAVPLMEAYRRGLAKAFADLARERPTVRVVTLDGVDHQSIAGRHAVVVAAAMTAFLSDVGYG